MFFKKYDAFAKIDGGGAGRDKNDDRRMDKGEWLAGYAGCRDYGFLALAEVKDDAGAEAVFSKMDDNGGGIVLLDEWCEFLKKVEAEAGTPLGHLLCEAEELPAATAGGGGGGAGPGVAFPACGLEVQPDASQDLLGMLGVFHPLAEETPEGTAACGAAWGDADNNGNGLCSLAELETWVLKALLAKYPNTGKGKDLKTPGRDLWDAYRPCYIRAFKDAADYAKDEGVTIKGTKSAKQDDFVDKKEFRLFVIYVCIYAAMVCDGNGVFGLLSLFYFSGYLLLLSLLTA